MLGHLAAGAFGAGTGVLPCGTPRPLPRTDTASFQRTPLGVWYLSRQLAQSRLSTAWISYTVPRLAVGGEAQMFEQHRPLATMCAPLSLAVCMQKVRQPLLSWPRVAKQTKTRAPVGQGGEGALHQVYVAGAPLALVPRLLHQPNLQKRTDGHRSAMRGTGVVWPEHRG